LKINIASQNLNGENQLTIWCLSATISHAYWHISALKSGGAGSDTHCWLI